ncbi:MAG: MarR family winged helix-turn-helix transcriptional regulator [Acidimicrobiales bacterium]
MPELAGTAESAGGPRAAGTPGTAGMAGLVRADLPAGQVEWAVSRLVRWSLRQDVQHAIVARSGVSITLAHAWALATVVECGPLRLSELAERLGIDASTLTPRVRQLVADGLVERSEDPADRRAARIVVTPAGQEAFAALRTARRELLDEALVELDLPERASLGRALAAVVSHLEQGLGGTER